MSDGTARRPLKVRDLPFSKTIAQWLSQKNITPNQISIVSIFFSILAAICLLFLPSATSTWKWLLPLLATVFIQGRLLCNLFDGMVAVEGGKKTPAGELFNDVPDRIADPLILIAAGYAVTIVGWSSVAGWCAGLLAVMTAYIRTLSASAGAPMDYQGPMAKQQRMAIMTAACLMSMIETQGYIMLVALVIICLGCVITLYRRTRSAYNYLENKHV